MNKNWEEKFEEEFPNIMQIYYSHENKFKKQLLKDIKEDIKLFIKKNICQK